MRASAVSILVAAGSAWAQPVLDPWPTGASPDARNVAAAGLAGAYATASTSIDAVDFRDIRGASLARIERAQLEGLISPAVLDAGPDGPRGVALTDSGRLAFIAIDDDPPAPGGGVIARLDLTTGQLVAFDRPALSDPADPQGSTPMAHWRGRLYVGTSAGGGPRVLSYLAGANQTSGAPVAVSPLPAGAAIRGLAIDRENGVLYAASEDAIYRAAAGNGVLAFQLVGTLAGLRGLAWSDHYGLAGSAGLFALSSDGSSATVWSIPAAQAQGTSAFAPSVLIPLAGGAGDLASTADGRLLLARGSGPVAVREASDTRLGFEAFLRDEFDQAVAFARALATRPGVPAGWVIDGDVSGGTNFFPASPDGAAWAVMLLLAQHRVTTDPAQQAQNLALVRTILSRYAGLASGPAPSRTADGVMRHWINPQTGGAASGWDPEFATLSTMKISLAAARAAAMFPGELDLQRAHARLACGVSNRDAYVQAASPFRTYFKGLAGGGPDLNSGTQAFNESILWIEQLSSYGGPGPDAAYAAWLDRARWPTATYLTGRPVTGDVAARFLPAFVTHYSALVQPDFRRSPAWQAQVANLRDSSAAWTDDNGPRFNTVFSAGTTKTQWNAGGYNADSLSNFPGRIATFPSLMAFAAGGRTVEAVGAYQAYRRGARQTFAGGASILYRRSDIDRVWSPNAAGLPDVALGALGLAELIRPDTVPLVLSRPLVPCPCAANCDGSTGAPALSPADFICFLNAYRAGAGGSLADQITSYANCDGSTSVPVLTPADFVCYLGRFRLGCPP